MPRTKRLHLSLVMLFGMMMTAMALAGPAQAADGVYPPEVLGKSLSVPTSVAAEEGASELAFTGANALGVGAIGGLLLIGGAAMVFTARRRKLDA